ncbi:MAG TPA: hypothetical protein VK843_18185 [Planctomycetota bacterium]|nr:hypothetical protein [Planctomycetota bacterium]
MEKQPERERGWLADVGSFALIAVAVVILIVVIDAIHYWYFVWP